MKTIMKTVKIKLDTVDKVKSFSNILGRLTPDCDIVSESNRYIIDAKSIMGIFSLELSKPLNFVIHSDDKAECEAVTDAIKDFII